MTGVVVRALQQAVDTEGISKPAPQLEVETHAEAPESGNPAPGSGSDI